METVPVGTVCLTLPPPGAGTGVVARDRVVTGAPPRAAVEAVDPTDVDPVDVADVPTMLELPIGLVGTVCLMPPPPGAGTGVVARDRVLVGAAARSAVEPVDRVEGASVVVALVVPGEVADLLAALVVPVDEVSPVAEPVASVAVPELVPATPAPRAEEAADSATEVVTGTDVPEPTEAAPVGAELQPAVRTTAAASAIQRS